MNKMKLPSVPQKKKKKMYGRAGLYANIHAKRARGEKMRDKGDAGAPTDQDFKNAAKTAKKPKKKRKKQ